MHFIRKASDVQTKEWFEFIKLCAGYTFMERTTGRKVYKYLVYELSKMNQHDVIAIADGLDSSVYYRVNSEGWFNGKCGFDYDRDDTTKVVRKSSQLEFTFESQLNEVS